MAIPTGQSVDLGADLALPPAPARQAPPSLPIRFRLWRNRQIASPAFRRLMARLPLLRRIANRKANDLFRLTAGFVYSQILGACVRLGVFEALAGRWLTTDALAGRCGLSADRMALLLEQAERLGLVVSVGPDTWMLDDAGAVIAADRGLAGMILHHDMFYRDLQQTEALLAGPRAETELRRYWSYVRGGDVDAITAEAVSPYSGLMADSQAMVADHILAAHDFGRYHRLIDVGGGDGAFVAAAARAHPELGVAVFDLPSVADRARIHLEAEGLGGRFTVQGGDFTIDPLDGEADCVSLIRILCDHDDDRVRQILANLHASMRPGAKIIVAEAMAGRSEGARLAAAYFSLYFLAMGSGRCRTDSEIAGLLEGAGFTHAARISTSNPLIATLVIAER